MHKPELEVSRYAAIVQTSSDAVTDDPVRADSSPEPPARLLQTVSHGIIFQKKKVSREQDLQLTRLGSTRLGSTQIHLISATSEPCLWL